MLTDDRAREMKEQTDATNTRNASSISERRDTHEQPEERPSSMYQSASYKDRQRSSLTSCAGSASDPHTPDPEIESSLAYTCSSSSRRGSIKREKRDLPPDEPNVVHEPVTLTADLPGLLRNKLLTAALSFADEEKKLLRDHTPESMQMNDTNSTVSSVHSPVMPGIGSIDQEENMEEKVPSMCSRVSIPDHEQLFMEDKSVRSESYLLQYAERVNCGVIRAQSAPVEVTSIHTQTDWSWMEDMQRYEQMKSEIESAQNLASDAADNGECYSCV